MRTRIRPFLGTFGVLASLTVLPCTPPPSAERRDHAETGGETFADGPTDTEELAPDGAVAIAPDVDEADAGPPAPAEPPSLEHAPWGLLSPMTPEIAQSMRDIAARNGRLRDDVFMKLGGSSIAAHAFLYCLRSQHMDLGEHSELEPVLEYFGNHNAGGRTPFTRDSEAARVGWSIRHGMAGEPPRVQREIDSIFPRFALAFYGGNDVQARRPRQYSERLESLIQFLVARGVVPILGATMPRGQPQYDEAALAYNRVSRALALAYRLPFVDFYGALEALPLRGLAGDGVHPNVHAEGGRGRPCDFTEDGLQRGFNVRNLLTLQALDQVRRVYAAGEPPPDPSPAPPVGAGTLADPRHLPQAPFAERVEQARLAELGTPSCAREGDPVRRALVYRIRLEEPTRIRVLALGRERLFRPGISVLADPSDAGTCAGYSGSGDLLAELGPGTWHVIVDARDETDDRFVFSLDVEPR